MWSMTELEPRLSDYIITIILATILATCIHLTYLSFAYLVIGKLFKLAGSQMMISLFDHHCDNVDFLIDPIFYIAIAIYISAQATPCTACMYIYSTS